MKKDIDHWISKCLTCLRHRRRPTKQESVGVKPIREVKPRRLRKADRRMTATDSRGTRGAAFGGGGGGEVESAAARREVR